MIIILPIIAFSAISGDTMIFILLRVSSSTSFNSMCDAIIIINTYQSEPYYRVAFFFLFLLLISYGT